MARLDLDGKVGAVRTGVEGRRQNRVFDLCRRDSEVIDIGVSASSQGLDFLPTVEAAMEGDRSRNNVGERKAQNGEKELHSVLLSGPTISVLS